MLIEEFRLWLLYKVKSENTINCYCKDIEQFFNQYKKDIICISTDDINSYKELLKQRNYNTKSINRKLVAFNQFIKFLNLEHKMNINIVIELERYQKVEYLETAVLTEEEFYRIVNQAEKVKDIRAVAVLYTLYLTGMRVSELLQLKLKDIGRDEVIVKGKSSKYRTVFIPDALQEIWQEYLKSRVQVSDSLFTGIRGALTRGTIYVIVRKYTGMARIKLDKGHPHALRHLYGYMAVKEGWSIDRLAAQMGHNNINTTKIYTLPPKSVIKKDVNEFARKKIKRNLHGSC